MTSTIEGMSVMPERFELLQGTLDVLVLKALSWGPRHGHAVARLIHASTDGAIEVLDGSLYAALHRLEARGWIASEWGLSDRAKRAKFYRLTPRGKKQLANEMDSWTRFSAVISAMLARVEPEAS